MLVWMMVCLVGSFLNTLSLETAEISQGLVGICLYGYSFVVFYSLRENFREEIAQGINVQVKGAVPPPQYDSQYAPQYAESMTGHQEYGQPQASYSQSYQQQEKYIP
jgi:hypothetical protein